ncbi:phosphopyruvate hydratase [Patescibacteria group bacterium]|nr:phosphopyruvate hydratase [Patescibacteria group bacterium]
MAKIKRIWAREILDSRGIPTVEVACQLDSGHFGVSSVPSGTSTGTHEALELRDKDESRYHGLGVLKAVENINKVFAPAVIGMDPTLQEVIDNKLISIDGTENKRKYGANAILAVSEVVSKVGAISQGLTLYSWINNLAQRKQIKAQMKVPTPIFVMIEGGLHGAGNLDFQEFHLIPASSKKYSDALRSGAEIFLVIGKNLQRRGATHSFGQEGGYTPNLFTNADAFEVIVDSIKQTPYDLGRDVFLGLDAAASFFFKNGGYTIKDKSAPMDDNALLEFYKSLNDQYHLEIIEDAFAQDEWKSWKIFYNLLGEQLLIVGDDLLTANLTRVQKAIDEKTCNAILVKPNQVGTVTETLDVIKKAKDANWKIIASHRGGETNDWFIADFAVGVGADYVKFGAPARGERVAKYNRLSSIEIELQ